MACTECQSKQWAIGGISGVVTGRENDDYEDDEDDDDDGTREVMPRCIHIDKAYTYLYYPITISIMGLFWNFLFFSFASVEWILSSLFSLPFSNR